MKCTQAQDGRVTHTHHKAKMKKEKEESMWTTYYLVRENVDVFTQDGKKKEVAFFFYGHTPPKKQKDSQGESVFSCICISCLFFHFCL